VKTGLVGMAIKRAKSVIDRKLRRQRAQSTSSSPGSQFSATRD
jgi:hypothetical protein